MLLALLVTAKLTLLSRGHWVPGTELPATRGVLLLLISLLLLVLLLMWLLLLVLLLLLILAPKRIIINT